MEPHSGNLLKKQAMDQNFITSWMQLSSDQYLRLKCRSRKAAMQTRIPAFFRPARLVGGTEATRMLLLHLALLA